MESTVDIAVVGAGPAGLSAAINAVASGKSVRLMNTGTSLLKKGERIDNHLGFYGVSGKDMMEAFELHAKFMGISVERGRVVNIMPFDGIFMINFNSDIFTAKTVVLATGVMRSREIKGEAELLGSGVSYCAVCDASLYRGKHVVAWGLSADGVSEANFLVERGVRVTYVSKGARPAGLETSVEFVEGALTEISGDEKVEAAYVGSLRIEADGVFVLRDTVSFASLVDGLETENGYVAVNRFMETNIPGLYAAGDCTGKPLQIAKAVGDGLMAAQQASRFIDNNK